MVCRDSSLVGVTRRINKPRFPQKPQFGTTASLVHSVQYILYPPTHPRTRTLSIESTYSALAHRGRALPTVRWLFELHCARVLRAGRAQRTSQTQVSPETPVWHHCLSCPQCAVYSLPTHPPPNPHPLNRVYLQCTRTPGPRAPARQMVVRITLCTCLEGREGPENQPNPGFLRNPSLAPLPLLSTVCSIFSDGQGQEDVPVRGTLGREGRAPRLTINVALLYPDVV